MDHAADVAEWLLEPECRTDLPKPGDYLHLLVMDGRVSAWTSSPDATRGRGWVRVRWPARMNSRSLAASVVQSALGFAGVEARRRAKEREADEGEDAEFADEQDAGS